MMMVKVHVLGRNDGVVKIVLNVNQFFDESPLVMVVGHRYRPGHQTVIVPFFLDELFPDKVADRLGAIAVIHRLDVFVERIDQFFFERNAETV